MQVAEHALTRAMRNWTQSIVALLAGSAVDDNHSHTTIVDQPASSRQYYFLIDSKAGGGDAVGLIVAECANSAFRLFLAPANRHNSALTHNDSAISRSESYRETDTADEADSSAISSASEREMVEKQKSKNAFDALISRERLQQKQQKEVWKKDVKAAKRRRQQDEAKKSLQTVMLDVDTRCSVPVEVGISHMWIHPRYRQLGLMEQGLDCVRATWHYVRVLPVEALSFSALRVEGYLFASSYVADRKGACVHIYAS
jgi:hypothetical protein